MIVTVFFKLFIGQKDLDHPNKARKTNAEDFNLGRGNPPPLPTYRMI